MGELLNKGETGSLTFKFEHALPVRLLSDSTRILLVDRAGIIRAAFPNSESKGRHVSEIIPPPSSSNSSEAVTSKKLADEERVISASRKFDAGEIVAYQKLANPFSSTASSTTTLTIALALTTSFVVLILGFAFYWQSTRAREADKIYEVVRLRINAALIQGRCGLWDWDIQRDQMYWSTSMFQLLGIQRQDELIDKDEARDLFHPADTQLSDIFDQASDRRTKFVDRTMRMRHATRGWIPIRLRAEVNHSRQGGAHLIGAAFELSEGSTINKTIEQLDGISKASARNNSSSRARASHALSEFQRKASLHTNKDGAVELVGLANDLGFKVYLADLSYANVDSAICSDEGTNQSKILLHQALATMYARWTLAKTLSEHLLRNKSADQTPDESNAFARAILLPEAAVLNVWREIGDEEAIAAWFQVPSDVARARIRDLGLH
jgi:PAS domain-containing protein